MAPPAENGAQVGKVVNFDHVTFWVGNALQAATFYCVRLGFKPLVYQGLETGNKNLAIHVVQQNKIRLVFVSPYNPGNAEMGDHMQKHGDGIKDIAFAVEDLESIVKVAKEKGAQIVRDIWTETDSNGTARYATIRTYGDVTHTLIDRRNYTGAFLPNFHPSPIMNDPLLDKLPVSYLNYIDHVNGNQPDGQMYPITEWYERILQFHRFWSFTDLTEEEQKAVPRSVIVCNESKTIAMPINEPTPGHKDSKVREYVQYYGSAGVQHVAFNCSNVVATVENLKARGLQFMPVPKAYYTTLRQKLKAANVKMEEDIDKIEELKILIDYDKKGYLLQIFTKPVQDRPTLCFEFIQRHGTDGFGFGNFKALFEAMETEGSADKKSAY